MDIKSLILMTVDMIHSTLVKAIFYKQLRELSVSKRDKFLNFCMPLSDNPTRKL
ncbi:hypothetical protein ACFL2G_00255 [Candidatus Omnitrophota bacterium]